MGNPTPNAFVSTYKYFRIKLVENTPPWIIETRTGGVIIGHIKLVNKEWCFVPRLDTLAHITPTQLLDIATAIKAVEKRTDNPALYV